MEQLIKTARARNILIGMVIVGFLLFSLSLALLMVPNSQIIEENMGGDLTCLQIPFTQSRAAAILSTYNDEALSAARALHLPGDLIFPVGYAMLYAGLIGLLVRKKDGLWLRIGLVVIFFPFIAMFLDWVENLFILRMLTITSQQSTADIPAWLPALGGLAGALKYLFLSLLTPLFGITLIISSLIRRQPVLTVGTAVLFLLAFGLLGFNLFQLFTEVLPCFA